jgi:hypothetical protein
MRYPSLFLPLTRRDLGADHPRRLPSVRGRGGRMLTLRLPAIRGRGGRMLALLAASGLLAVSAVVAGTAVPALADSFFVELAASPSAVAVGGTTTLTATTGADVGPTPWFIDIFDTTTGLPVRFCGSGTTCSTAVSETGTLLGYCSTGTSCSMHTEPSVNGDFMIAFIASYIQLVSQHYPPPLSTLQASSNVVLSRGFYG